MYIINYLYFSSLYISSLNVSIRDIISRINSDISFVLASFISVKKAGLSKDILEKIKNHVLKIYKKISFFENDIQEIIKLLVHDKKNSHERINFVLIKNIGIPVYDIEVNNDLIIEAFKYYSS